MFPSFPILSYWEYDWSIRRPSFVIFSHVIGDNVGKTMSQTTNSGMVTRPPIKMVLAGGWFLALFYPHYREKRAQKEWFFVQFSLIFPGVQVFIILSYLFGASISYW